MATVAGSQWRDRTGTTRRWTLLLGALIAITAACSSTAASEAPPSSEAIPTSTAAVPVPAMAEATGGGLDAPHSGDRPVSAGCPVGGEMLDWDGDGWGDCVNSGVAPQVPLPDTDG